MKLICYQDEKMYGPPSEGTTKEELESQIRELEIKIYGHALQENTKLLKSNRTIYDIDARKSVNYDEFIKTDRGIKFLEEINHEF